MPRKLTSLFLCTANACRSQMAEGWARHLHGDLWDVYSAGVQPQGLNEDAVRVMAEAGVDISGQRSKQLSDLPDIAWDVVVTVCDDAREACPVIPGAARTLHRSFDDPPRLARDARNEHEHLFHFRRVRDAIRDFVEALPAELGREW